MEENLLGYLLKALDDGADREVEASLRHSPQLRSRLDLLERAVAPLAVDRETVSPPSGLVLSTLALIAEHQCRKLPDAPPPPRSHATPTGRPWLRRPDVLVAAVLLIFLGGIGSSYLVHLWRDYDGRNQCRNNLFLVWSGLKSYCDTHDGNFPRVEENGSHGVAGMFIPTLRDSGMLAPEVSVACPAQERQPPDRRSVRELEELFAKDPDAFRVEARKQAGGYAYTLGYVDASGHHGLRCDSGDQLPIVADRLESLTHTNSVNHGGFGQNILYLGGDVQWRTTRHAGIDGDDIFVNWDHQVRAGKAKEDTVLGPGDASPMPRD
jgi:hypothetical protein